MNLSTVNTSRLQISRRSLDSWPHFFYRFASGYDGLYFFEVESAVLHVIKVSPLLDRIIFDRSETGTLFLLKKIVIHFFLAHIIDRFFYMASWKRSKAISGHGRYSSSSFIEAGDISQQTC